MTALRRADWRFLLPAAPEGGFRKLVLLGGGSDLPERLEGLAGEITEHVEDVRDADAVVIMAEFAGPLAPVLRDTGPGATLYVEVDRRKRGRHGLTPSRLRAVLGRAGLIPTATHWVIPDFARARRHIPLDAPRALEWYLSTLQTAGSLPGRLADASIRLLARAGAARLAACVPCYSMTAVGRGRSPGPVGVLAPLVGPVAMLTSGVDDGSRVVLLPFENGGAAPSRVVKVPRLSSFDGHTEREQHTLAEFRSRLPAALRPSLPEPLGLRRWNGRLVAAESYAPGTPVVVSSGRYGASSAPAHEDLRQVVDWLIAFHRATRLPDGTWSAGHAERTAVRIERCRELLAADSPGQRLLAAAAHAARGLAGRTLPLVPLHNDLGPWNIHRDGARTTVIDWELGDDGAPDRIGAGPCDLLYFTTHWYLRVRHLRRPAAELRGVRELYGGATHGTQARDAAREEIRRYAEELGVETRFLPMLLVSTFAERALDGDARARRAPAPRAPENRYARYLEALAGRTRDWFEEHRWP